ncbi:uncharacterized protein BKA55DRAFT_4027 [Fusarium redolens]|uniref:Uncharacterized protein n=1 Tax=Fusarium redolens TaxID=48865 RepID=A0A9P9KVF2_FUSRE|nr:uncharacterized protein BKA55DRAFT_4027 [Fusarium redolens]KAH7269267.1 hypothetical protein BKA55DRAFT_4027 [Fusarium redolens]
MALHKLFMGFMRCSYDIDTVLWRGVVVNIIDQDPEPSSSHLCHLTNQIITLVNMSRPLNRHMSCHRQPSGKNDLLCPSWVYSPTSNIHITRDYAWVEDDYMAFSSIIYHGSDEPWENAQEFLTWWRRRC